MDIALSKDVNGGYVHIYRIDSLRDTIPEYIIPDTTSYFGINLATGDFNGDHQPDLAVAAASGDSAIVKFYWGGPVSIPFQTLKCGVSRQSSAS